MTDMDGRSTSGKQGPEALEPGMTTAEKRLWGKLLARDRRSVQVRRTEWARCRLQEAGFPTEVGWYAVLHDGSLRKAVPEDAKAPKGTWKQLVNLSSLVRERTSDRMTILAARIIEAERALDLSYKFFGVRLHGDDEAWGELMKLVTRAWTMGDLSAEIAIMEERGLSDEVGRKVRAARRKSAEDQIDYAQ